MKTCAKCGHPMCKTTAEGIPPGQRRFDARGLCHICYSHLRERHPDKLLDYPRKNMAQTEFVEEYRYLWESGMRDDHVLADKLGLKLDTMRTARSRAIKAGFPLPRNSHNSIKYT